MAQIYMNLNCTLQLVQYERLRNFALTRQSVAVQCDGAFRLAQKIPIITLRECIFELFLLKKSYNP